MSRAWKVTVIVLAAGIAAVSLIWLRDDPEAEADRRLAERDRALRDEHPDTVALRHLAHWRRESGDLAGAMEAYEQLLADRVRVLGEDHPQVLATRHNLAGLRGEAGDAAGAAEAYGQLLADMVRVLGPDHPHTGLARNNLARWRGKAGDDGRADRP
jgi:Tetratricopeptide repeat